MSSSLDISAAMHCSVASWSFHMLHLRKTSSAVGNLLPAQHAHQKYWLLRQMGTGSYIAFAEVEGALSSSDFIDLLLIHHTWHYSGRTTKWCQCSQQLTMPMIIIR